MPLLCVTLIAFCRVTGADDGQRTAKRQRTAKLPAAIVLDIEGTVAPISFVTEVRCYTQTPAKP